jgi:hypothetical protein
LERLSNESYKTKTKMSKDTSEQRERVIEAEGKPGSNARALAPGLPG